MQICLITAVVTTIKYINCIYTTLQTSLEFGRLLNVTPNIALRNNLYSYSKYGTMMYSDYIIVFAIDHKLRAFHGH